MHLNLIIKINLTLQVCFEIFNNIVQIFYFIFFFYQLDVHAFIVPHLLINFLLQFKNRLFVICALRHQLLIKLSNFKCGFRRLLSGRHHLRGVAEGKVKMVVISVVWLLIFVLTLIRMMMFLLLLLGEVPAQVLFGEDRHRFGLLPVETWTWLRYLLQIEINELIWRNFFMEVRRAYNFIYLDLFLFFWIWT